MDIDELVIVGSGLSGLELSSKLTALGVPNIVVEQEERGGGVFRFDGIPVDSFDASARVAKLLSEGKVMLNSSVVRIGSSIWLVSSTHRKKLKDFVSATGFRNLTPSELGIFGDRPSGVYGMQTAIDIVSGGYKIGRNVALCGLNHYSLFLAKYLKEKTEAKITFVGEKMDTLIHEWDEFRKLGEVVESRILGVKGANRIEKLHTEQGYFDVEALVVCRFASYNYLNSSTCVGNCRVVIEEPRAITDLSVATASALRAEETATITSNIPCYPEKPALDGSFIAFAPERSGDLLFNGHKISFRSPYVRLNVRGERSLEVSFPA